MTITRYYRFTSSEVLAAAKTFRDDCTKLGSEALAMAESFGGKFLGASADVADKIAKRLAIEVKEARNSTSAATPEHPAKFESASARLEPAALSSACHRC